MKRKGGVWFWIFFPILALLIGAILIFYLDLADGPFFIFVLSLIAFGLFVLFRILSEYFFIKLLNDLIFFT